ncbi:hypothetical protein FEM48_Zijuj05G0018600 [Ziziphus jujuba var. spinosa]|uniref:Leucine-rich repeat-containing N-terminal plant-type domain-containing protein n=1 Tax=Ziziphus jujuba var. spinosa TaxID=714518 RepID=A0A978VC43_ZIZJJ|nr:hypothetical protein FEM48_Zijuj05G0018600 [Ziziphus jujuba var. spinosa]
MDSDREALVDFKSGLHDPENRLSSWKGGNCCQWWGISCENTSGAVIAVDLHNPHPYNYGESTAGLVSLKHLVMNEVDLSMVGPDFSIHILGWENYEIVGSYYESYVVNMKGQPLRYTKTLSLVTVLDLSGNNLSGDLLIEITNLLGLRVIDLSRNQITGHIPESISKLKLLVSLDLSRNSFSGAIPQSLGTLSFLGYLNLSNNDLSGPIPYKDHMSTFDEFSFAGNLGLCGGPLAVKCPSDDDDDEKSDKGRTTSKDAGNGDSFIDKWFYLSIGLGFAAGILVPYLIMAMRKSWSITYFDVVDKVVDRMLYLWLKYRTTKQRTRGHQRRR